MLSVNSDDHIEGVKIEGIEQDGYDWPDSSKEDSEAVAVFEHVGVSLAPVAAGVSAIKIRHLARTERHSVDLPCFVSVVSASQNVVVAVVQIAPCGVVSKKKKKNQFHHE